MSFLYPLYALGALALAAPILFHFFQRRPHGQQEFSSLMFLRSTPPKITRRSRLNDLLLLLLRGLALLLLALAFCRPFLRSSVLLDVDAPLRSVVLLVDTSASMRREGVWPQLRQSVAKVVTDLRPTDQVMLVAFDRFPTALISFEAWEQAASSQRIALVTEQLESLKPSWFATDLGSALVAAADALLQLRLVEEQGQPLQVVLFTDLQDGSDLNGLQSYQWPEDISVDVRTVSATKQANASLQTLPPEPSDMDSAQIRVLVRNEANSPRGKLQLQWQGEQLQPVKTYVPPGQTRVVRVTQPRNAVHLKLAGDDHAFDNQLFLTETVPLEQALWYIGDDQRSDQQSLFFYLRQSTLDTRTRKVSIEKLEELTRLAIVNPKQVPLIVVSKPLMTEDAAKLQRYVSRGGRLLVVLEASSEPQEMEQFLGQVLGVSAVKVKAISGVDYAMLSKIDFQNALLQPFSDPRFNDFSKIQFWSHRALTTTNESPWNVVAEFDDGFPALVEKQLGKGTAWVLTSGWQPQESQLALSSKFVPLLHGFFGQTIANTAHNSTYVVGEPIKITPTEEPTSVIAPDGETHDLPAMSEVFDAADEPGIYQLTQGMEQFSLAVNLPPEESRTNPLLPDRLAQLGIPLGKQKSAEALRKQQRQMRNKELEGRQKLWRWGILAALGAVTIETWLSSRTRELSFGSGSI